MSNVGAVLFDKDAVYINLPHAHFTRPEMVRAPHTHTRPVRTP